MVEFCDRCDASIPERAPDCPECGARFARRTARAPRRGRVASRSLRRTRARHRIGTRRSGAATGTWIATASLTFAVGLAFVLTVPGPWSAVLDGAGQAMRGAVADARAGSRPPAARVEPEVAASAALVSAEVPATGAERRRKEAGLMERSCGFLADWKTGDVEKLSGYYAARRSRNATQLPRRLRKHGFGEDLGTPAGVAEYRHAEGPDAREIDFQADGRSVRTVWKYEDADWQLISVLLDRPRSDFLVDAAEYFDWGRPAVRLWIEDAAALESLPRAVAASTLCRELAIAGGADAEVLASLGDRVVWPVELRMWWQRGRTAWCLRTSAEQPGLIAGLLAGLSSLDAEELASRSTTEVAGRPFHSFPLTGHGLYEGLCGGSHWVIAVPGRDDDGARLVAGMLSTPLAPSAEERRLWARTAGGSLRGYLSIEALAESDHSLRMAREEGLLRSLCGDFGGVAIRGGAEGVRRQLEVSGGLDADGGVLGAFLPDRSVPPLPLGWVPGSTAEFVWLRLRPAALREQRHVLARFGLDLDPATWDDDVPASFDSDLVWDVLSQLDGVFGVLSPGVSSGEAVRGVAQEAGVVCAIGFHDVAGFWDGLDQLVEVRDWIPFRDRPEVAEGVVSVTGGGIGLLIAPRDELVFVALDDPRSARFLRQVLATEGRAGLPAQFARRVPELPSNAVSASFGSGFLDLASAWAEQSATRRSRFQGAFERSLESMHRQGDRVHAVVTFPDATGQLVTRVVY